MSTTLNESLLREASPASRGSWSRAHHGALRVLHRFASGGIPDPRHVRWERHGPIRVGSRFLDYRSADAILSPNDEPKNDSRPLIFVWLCERRRDYSPNDDVWDVRWRWDELRPRLQEWLRAGVYRIGAVRRFPAGDETVEVWPALDALVLKATALVLAAHWGPVLSPLCFHLEGRGGAKAAVRFVDAHRADNTFVFRTDVKSYYASIDHEILLTMLDRHVPDGWVLDLLRQYVRRTIYDGGLYEDVERGIALGCPLPLLMGAFYLKLLDERMEATGLAYARFMDDWVILAPTRWKLRAAIRLVNETLAELHVQQHPDKTFIGRVSRGFDFLGYRFTPTGLEVAPRAVASCVERVARLYE